MCETEQPQERDVGGPIKDISIFGTSKSANYSSSISRIGIEDNKARYSIQVIHGGPCSDNGKEMLGEEEFPEVKVDFQETFLVLTSPISRCCFSASGNNIASSSVDGTVSHTKCSMLARPGSSYLDSLGFASLTVWNMRTWRAMTVLPLGENPPAFTSLCFNQNGKILAAAATDGIIHICLLVYKLLAGLHMMLPYVLFFLGSMRQTFSVWVQMGRFLNGVCRTKVISFGQGVVAGSVTLRRQTIVDVKWLWMLMGEGCWYLVTSGAVRAPIYKVRGYVNGLRTVPHSAAITTVDWHPTLPIFLTGSADNSVQVTSLS